MVKTKKKAKPKMRRAKPGLESVGLSLLTPFRSRK